MVGRLCAMISLIIPTYLVVVMAGWRKTLEVLPAVVVCGVSFASVQFYVSNYMGPELTDILELAQLHRRMVLVLKFWKPRSDLSTGRGHPPRRRRIRHSAGQVFVAWLPYMLLVDLRADMGRGRRQAGDRYRSRTGCCRRFCREARRS